jgi:ubiquinone/menaquinone biosynthesis C-methylase UbiE
LPPAVVVRVLDLHGTETIIDFGAGTGMYTIPLAEALPNGRVIAIDELAELLERLRGKLTQPGREALKKRIQLVSPEDGRVPLADAVAQRVLMLNVIHHVHDEPAVLAEITRLLAPGGRLAVIDYGAIDRPVGPSKEHVLANDELRAVVARMGLAETAFYEPGELVPYHAIVVAEKPGETSGRS